MNSDFKFSLTFDGEGLDNNEFDPALLSTALLAIESIFKESNSVLNAGHNTDIKVNVQGSFESGSFIINWVISHNFFADLFTNQYANAICNATAIFAFLFGTGKGLVHILKFLKGGRPDRIFENEDGSFTIEKNNKLLKVEKEELQLIRNQKIRREFENLVSPLKHNGIDSLYVRARKSNEAIQICDKSEVPYFKCPEPEEEKIDGEVRFETSLNIISLSFKEGNKWYVNDGQSSFYVIVEDEYFLQQIENSVISFAKGDIMRVVIRREQFYNKTENKLKTEHFIEKVIDHKKPMDQLLLEL